MKWHRDYGSCWWRRLTPSVEQVVRKGAGGGWRYECWHPRAHVGWALVSLCEFSTLREAKEWADRDPAVKQEDGR